MSLVNKVMDNLGDMRRFGLAFPLRLLSNFAGKSKHAAMIDGMRFYIRRNSWDINVIRNIFIDGDYDFTRFPQSERVWRSYNSMLENGEQPIIVDAGANIGAASLWLARQFPRALIYAVEPDPDNAEMCRLNTMAFSNIKVVEAAIGCSSGKVEIEKFGENTLASRTKFSDNGAIQVMTISDLFENGKPFIVKIDIEGFESELFGKNTEWLEGVSLLMIEPHDYMLPGRFTSMPFLRAIAQYSFEMLISRENLMFIK